MQKAHAEEHTSQNHNNHRVSKASGTLSSLLRALNASPDTRLTVGQWVRDYPQETQGLSPHEVGQILSRVNFALEQPSVAGELTAGMLASLTCAHVGAAVRACPHQAAEVARVMAPAVQDPEQKEDVLALIEYSFERQSVAHCFPDR